MPEWLGGSFLNPFGVEPFEKWRFASSLYIRWYHRLIPISKKALTEELNQDDWDFIYTYFMWCWHLRDWLIASHPELKSKIDDFVKSNVEMQVIQDICNGLKHSQLTRPKRDAGFNIYREYDYLAEECGENPVKYKIASDLCVCKDCGRKIPEDKNNIICECGEKFQKGINDFFKIDLFELILRSKVLWQDFLEKEGLISPPE